MNGIVTVYELKYYLIVSLWKFERARVTVLLCGRFSELIDFIINYLTESVTVINCFNLQEIIIRKQWTASASTSGTIVCIQFMCCQKITVFLWN